MEDQKKLVISFDNTTPADASKLALELEDALLEGAPSAKIALMNDREDSQDMGSTLVLVFGTPVAIALARSVGAFLQRHSGAAITITSSGKVIAKNLDSADAARIAEAFGVQRPG